MHSASLLSFCPSTACICLLSLHFISLIAEQLESDLIGATVEKKELYESLREVRGVVGVENESLGQLLRDRHQTACKVVTELKASSIKAAKNKPLILSAKKLMDDLDAYLKKSKGRYENKLEYLISRSPINAQHNPFYNGSFNGNDCFRLIENYELIFNSLKDCANANPVDRSVDESTHNAMDEAKKISDEAEKIDDRSADESTHNAMDEAKEISDEAKKINDICRRHGAIWYALAKLLPSFRSTKKLTQTQKQKLLRDIDSYWDSYIDNCNGSVTIKLHLLKEHVMRLLEMYDTIGLFSEDASESIHAIVNALARRYAALDKARRITQVVRAMESRKRRSVDIEKTKVEEGKTTKKKTRKQGANKGGGASMIDNADDKKYDVAVADAVSFLELIESSDAEQSDDADHTFLGPNTVLISCEKCKRAGTDMSVPDVLLPLHYLIVHSERGAEIPIRKET
jgi:hypothetical protein